MQVLALWLGGSSVVARGCQLTDIANLQEVLRGMQVPAGCCRSSFGLDDLMNFLPALCAACGNDGAVVAEFSTRRVWAQHCRHQSVRHLVASGVVLHVLHVLTRWPRPKLPGVPDRMAGCLPTSGQSGCRAGGTQPRQADKRSALYTFVCNPAPP